MKKVNYVRVLLATVLLVLALVCTAGAETLPDYDAAATLKYADAHCEDETEPGATKDDCIEFARTCVQKGGVPKDKDRVFKDGTGYTVGNYVEYMIDNGYAELNKLTMRPHTDYYGKTYQYVHMDDNQGLVAPGDIIIYKCLTDGCKKEGYFHASICAPADEEGTYAGYFRYYAHNTQVNNKILCTINCGGCKEREELYALHITSGANGYERYVEKTTAKVKCTAYNKLNVSWPDSENMDGCYVFYRASGKAFWKKVAVAEGTSYTYTIPKDYYGATQYFRVAPYKVKDGKTLVGAKSDSVSAYTVPAAPSKVTLQLTEYRKVKVSWPKVAGATVYKVEYQPKGSSKWSFLYRGSKTYAYTKNLTAGKKYTFRVTTFTSSKAYKGERPSNKYKSSYIYTLKQMDKTTMKRLNKKTVQVSWKAVTGADGYEISKSTSTKKSGTVKPVKSSKTTKYKISATKGKKYYYKVRAYSVENGKNVYGPWSTPVKY